MTHNQVAYWDMTQANAARRESNRIANYEAETGRFKAEREEYWSQRNYSWNESLFGFELFKTFAGMIAMAAMA